MRSTFRVAIALMLTCVLDMAPRLPPVFAGSQSATKITFGSQQRNCAPGVLRCPRRGDNLAWNDPTIPYIISPRRTYLLSDKIVIRWNPVANAKRYIVRIQGEGSSQTFTVGDGQQPAPAQLVNPNLNLKSGVYYLITVESDTGQFSQQEDRSELGFWLLDQKQVAAIQQSLNQVNQQEQTDIEKQLARIKIYRQHQLYAEAIATLEPLVQQNPPSAIFDQTLAELYIDVQLPSLAIPTYERAIANSQDPQQQADLLTDLGDLYTALREKEKAQQSFQAALTRYQSVGSNERLSELQRKLQTLKD